MVAKRLEPQEKGVAVAEELPDGNPVAAAWAMSSSLLSRSLERGCRITADSAFGFSDAKVMAVRPPTDLLIRIGFFLNYSS